MRLSFILFLGLLSCATARQAVGVQAIDVFFSPAGKAYFLMSDKNFVTQNALGQTMNEFYDSSLGLPDQVDVTNPFSIILYYQDYGQIVILDRTLSELSRIDLFATEGLQQPGALARANDNQIWVYDTWNYQLKLLDNQGKIVRRTNNLRLELGVTEDPTAIYVDRGKVALHFSASNRLAQLTNFGRFEYWVPLPATAQTAWSTPYLTGYDSKNSWRWVAGAKTAVKWARPLVQGEGEIKRRPRKDGYQLLLKSGKVIFVPVEG